MGLSKLKNITRTFLSSSNPTNRLFYAKNPIFTSTPLLRSQPPKPAHYLPRFKLFTNPCLSLPLHPWITQKARLLCSSETVKPDESVAVAESEVEKVYRVIMENSHDYSDLGKALDGFGVTTDLVAEILERLKFEEKLAFRFFNWAGQQQNYAHEPRVYTDMVNILTSTKYKIKQFRIVCEMLHYMRRNEKKSVPIDVLLPILRNYCEKHLTHVRKFAKKKQIRVKTQPEINAFNLLLDSLCKCGLAEDAEAMFTRFRTIIKPNETTFNVLFFGWCRVRNPKRAIQVLDEMTERGLAPDNFTYVAALDAFCKVGMVSEAVELFESTRINGSALSSPIAKTYAIVILALVRSERTDEAYKYMSYMMESGCVPCVSTYKEMIEGMCLAGKFDMAYKFLEEMGNRGYPLDIVTYNCLLKVLCDNKQRDEAIELFRAMSALGCEPSSQTYNMMIEMFFEAGDPKRAIETWDEMYKRRCELGVNTYCVMIEGFFRCGEVKKACELLEEVVNKKMKLPYRKFESILAELSAIGDLRAIHRLSEHMRTFYNPFVARRFALNDKRMRSIGPRGGKR